jgi:two-component system chemotaxis response regulator CheB
MDLHMPGMDGFETTRRIMETKPVPIIICTATSNASQVALSFRSLEAGAIACVAKPVGREHADFSVMAENLRQTVKLMSEVKVVRRWPRPSLAPTKAVTRPDENQATAGDLRIIGIGASTGGPPVLQTILASLPKDFPVPVLVVQHITQGFLPGLAEWLNQTTSLQIQIAAYGCIPLPGHVYLAPDGYHMEFSAAGRIVLTKEAQETGLRPSVAHLFHSLAEVCGADAVGVLLTGMGKDGAVELKQMKDRGATTIAQDRESSVVHGMPGEAIALGGATHVLPADKIADFLRTFAAAKS